MQLEVCCICLDDTLPIQRFACGCKAAWFHSSCCSQWIDSTSSPYSCPVCRRYIPMTTNYSFSYQAGDSQKHLWHCLVVYLTEVILCTIATLQGIELVWIFPVQSAAILLCPFILSSNNTYDYFLFHSTFLISVKGVYILLIHSADTLLPGILFLRTLSYIHLIVLYSLHFIQYQNRFYIYNVVDPFEPYAISRDILIAETLYSQRR